MLVSPGQYKLYQIDSGIRAINQLTEYCAGEFALFTPSACWNFIIYASFLWWCGIHQSPNDIEWSNGVSMWWSVRLTRLEWPCQNAINDDDDGAIVSLINKCLVEMMIESLIMRESEIGRSYTLLYLTLSKVQWNGNEPIMACIDNTDHPGEVFSIGAKGGVCTLLHGVTVMTRFVKIQPWLGETAFLWKAKLDLLPHCSCVGWVGELVHSLLWKQRAEFKLVIGD